MSTIAKIWSRSEIETLLSTNNRAVEKGVVAIFQYQTDDEKSTDSTRHNNNVGFCAWAAKKGSYYAKWVQGGRSLTGNHLENARRICLHHAGQLTQIAQNKT